MRDIDSGVNFILTHVLSLWTAEQNDEQIVNLTQKSLISQIRHQLHRSHRPRDEKDYKATNTFVPSVAINNAVDSTRHYRHVENVILDVNAVFLPLKSENLNEEYVCSCGKSFKSFDKLNAHETTHPSSDSQLLYICNICNKEFPIRSYLHQHLVTHDNERKHKCTMCTKTFKRVAGLNQVTYFKSLIWM